jgi:hypothetical protein
MHHALLCKYSLADQQERPFKQLSLWCGFYKVEKGAQATAFMNLANKP